MTNRISKPKTNRVRRKSSGEFARGIALRQLPERGNQWLVAWVDRSKPGRVRRSQLFKTKELAVSFARDLESRFRRFGSEMLAFNAEEWRRWLAFKEELAGAGLDEVLGVWKNHLVVRAKSKMTLCMGIPIHLDLLKREGVSSAHLAHVKKHLGRLSAYFGGDSGVIELGTEGVREWLAVLADEGGDNGEGFGAETVKHHLKSVRSFFNRALAEGWILESPADPRRVKSPRVRKDEALALSVEEARRLLRINRDFPVCGRLALEMFAGVRCSGAIRLSREDVNWDDELLLLPDSKHKMGRFVLDGLPGNFWRWLRHADRIDGFWGMTPRQYLDRKAEAFARAGVENTGNILRRSFCSWRIAVDGDAARVAVMMQHSSPDTLYKQYKTSRTSTGFITRKQAGEWEKIVP